MRGTFWTDAEVDTLRRLRGSMPNRELAARLGRSPDSVKTKLKELARARCDDDPTDIRRRSMAFAAAFAAHAPGPWTPPAIQDALKLRGAA